MRHKIRVGSNTSNWEISGGQGRGPSPKNVDYVYTISKNRHWCSTV